jgi:hypothetical protein
MISWCEAHLVRGYTWQSVRRLADKYRRIRLRNFADPVDFQKLGLQLHELQL